MNSVWKSHCICCRIIKNAINEVFDDTIEQFILLRWRYEDKFQYKHSDVKEDDGMNGVFSNAKNSFLLNHDTISFNYKRELIYLEEIIKQKDMIIKYHSELLSSLKKQLKIYNFISQHNVISSNESLTTQTRLTNNTKVISWSKPDVNQANGVNNADRNSTKQWPNRSKE